jgi:two-component system chemotaxis response regulator CheV
MDAAEHRNVLESVNPRTRLAGSNYMEILLFSLGTRETFGINVFKVREIMRTPPITRTPNVPHGVEGVVSLRGSIIPVISLSKFVDTGGAAASNETMMVTEFNCHRQGFLVRGVDRIVQVEWNRVKAPDILIAGGSGLVTSITEIAGGRLVSILDVESIIAGVFGEPPVPQIEPVRDGGTVFFADDSVVARKEIMQVLDRLGVHHQHANNGREAWDRLQVLASRAQAEGEPLADRVKVILTDAEMPEMDGYVLTRRIKADARFAGIPVVMHSSLSSEANRAMGSSVGVDAYVAKFDAGVLAETLRPYAGRSPAAGAARD